MNQKKTPPWERPCFITALDRFLNWFWKWFEPMQPKKEESAAERKTAPVK